jgi:hypothetical protein
VLAGTDPSPRREPSGTAEAPHVGTDLGEDNLGVALVDARDRVEQRELSFERGDEPIDLDREPLDGFVEVVELGEDLSDQQRMMRVETSRERVA